MTSPMLKAWGAFRDIIDFESFTILDVTATYMLISNPDKAHRFTEQDWRVIVFGLLLVLYLG